jgi:hypothetical protein
MPRYVAFRKYILPVDTDVDVIDPEPGDHVHGIVVEKTTSHPKNGSVAGTQSQIFFILAHKEIGTHLLTLLSPSGMRPTARKETDPWNRHLVTTQSMAVHRQRRQRSTRQPRIKNPSTRYARTVLLTTGIRITRITWEGKSSNTINGCSKSNTWILPGTSACDKPLRLSRGRTTDIFETRR